MFLKIKKAFLYLPITSLLASLVLGFYFLLLGQKEFYLHLIANEIFWDAFFYALKIAFWTITLSTVLFLSIYYLLFLLKFEYKQNISFWIFFFQIPIFLPYAFTAMLFFLLFFPVGIFADFMPFLLGTSKAVIIAYTYKVSAFLLFISLPALLQVKQNEIKLHQLYSDNLRKFFFKILLKRNLGVYIVGIFIVFAYIFNAYEIPYILGSNLEKMPAILVYEQLNEFGLQSMQKAYFMSFVYFVLVLFFLPLFFVCYKILKKVLS